MIGLTKAVASKSVFAQILLQRSVRQEPSELGKARFETTEQSGGFVSGLISAFHPFQTFAQCLLSTQSCRYPNACFELLRNSVTVP